MFTARQPSGEGNAFSSVCPLVILSTGRWVPVSPPPAPGSTSKDMLELVQVGPHCTGIPPPPDTH